jgi:hypothetical protein
MTRCAAFLEPQPPSARNSSRTPARGSCLLSSRKENKHPSGAHLPRHAASLVRHFLWNPHSRLGLHQQHVASGDVVAVLALRFPPEIRLVEDPDVIDAADRHAVYEFPRVPGVREGDAAQRDVRLDRSLHRQLRDQETPLSLDVEHYRHPILFFLAIDAADKGREVATATVSFNSSGLPSRSSFGLGSSVPRIRM